MLEIEHLLNLFSALVSFGFRDTDLAVIQLFKQPVGGCSDHVARVPPLLRLPRVEVVRFRPDRGRGCDGEAAKHAARPEPPGFRRRMNELIN